MKVLKLILNVIRIILILLVFGAVIVLAIGLLSGIKLYCVQTGSMEPELPVGSMVAVVPTDFSQLDEGDIITYVVSGNTVVTHRLVGIDSDKRLLTTKGDANNTVDISPVCSENVIGRVWFHIPLFGYVLAFFSTRFGKIMLGITVFGLIGVWFIRRMYIRDGSGDSDVSENGEDAEQIIDSETGCSFDTTDGSESGLSVSAHIVSERLSEKDEKACTGSEQDGK